MSEQLSNHQQLQQELDQAVANAIEADAATGSEPSDYKGIYHAHYNEYGLSKELKAHDKNSGIRAEVSSSFDGRQIRAHVSEKDVLAGGRFVDSHSYESTGDEPSWMRKDREGTFTKMYTHDKDGNIKTLESDNPVVSKMVARIALKAANTKAEQVLADANEKRAA